ncbi:MAG: HNH endonuclease [Spirulinaceae cyanobacterium]
MDISEILAATRDRVQSQVSNTVEGITQKADEIRDNTQKTVKKALEHSQKSFKQAQDQSLAVLEETIATATTHGDKIATAANSLGISALTLAESLKTLPQSAAELTQAMPRIAARLQYGAGLRPGDAPRSGADVMALFNKIPGTSKLEASEGQIRAFLADKHGSHITPHAHGGSNRAENIVWEVGADNIRRGANVMTPGEQIQIRCYNAVDSILTNSGTLAKLGITATGTAIITQSVITAIAYSLDLYRGDLTVEEYQSRILDAAICSGIAAPIFFLILIAVLALFPELTVILAAPGVVLGLNTLFGISIATPLIQSLLRHLEAGGFDPILQPQTPATSS